MGASRRPVQLASPAALLAAGLLAVAAGARGAGAQSLEAVPDTSRVTVGDPVEVRVRARLPEGAVAEDAGPVPADSLPEGVRILEAGGWRRGADGSLEARLRLAFFRPGERRVPPLAAAYRPAPAAPPDTVLSRAAPVQVVPVLPPGDQPLRDIKDLEPLPGSPLPWLALVLASVALVAAFLAYRRLRRRPARAAPTMPPPAPTLPLGPYEAALERLDRLERERLPDRGEVAAHYERAADVARRYLEEAEGVPAPELTTSELAWALPPDLAAGRLRERCGDLLGEADLVKFARMRPEPARAYAFLDPVRGLLRDWYSVGRTRPAATPSAELATSAPPGLGDAPDGAAGPR